MAAVPVCAQSGDASTKRPNAPTNADAATKLHPLIADEAAVLIVLVRRQTSLCSIMRNSSFEKAWMSNRIGHEACATKSDQIDRSESIARWYLRIVGRHCTTRLRYTRLRRERRST